MKREIKFRAWDKENRRWLKYFDVSQSGVVTEIMPQHKTKRDDIELVQFTGLSDKNGKEIYEGDIVSFSDDFDGKDMRSIGKIYWCEEALTYAIIRKDCEGNWFDWAGLVCANYIKIIGNIYENKDLLDKDKKNK